jgi:putative ABC transport system permease protein
VHAQSTLRLALGALQRHAALNALQILVFSLCLMLALIMLLVRTALLEDWRRELPPQTPNHFLINIAPYQVEPLEAFLGSHGLAHAGLYPMVPGRVMEVNGKPARVVEGEELNIEREFNLSWMDQLPPDNRITEGAWWGPTARDEVSVEAGVARSLGLHIGDTLTVVIGGQRIVTEVSSIRALEWDTMRPNFFLIFPRSVLERHAAMWLTSFYLPPERKPLLNELVREFPTVSLIEMDALMAQFEGITRQLALAVELVLALLGAAGVLVMVASVQAGLQGRFQESAVLRTLGAGRGLVLGSLVLEFALLGLLAGVLATVGAELAAAFVQTRLMDLGARMHPLVWLCGPLAGAAGAALLGLLMCRRVVDTPPVIVLRELS